MTQKQYGASMGGPISRDRTFYFANAEQRRLDQNGADDDLERQRRCHQRSAAGGKISWLAHFDRYLSESGRDHECSGEAGSPVQHARSVHNPVFLVRRGFTELARCRGVDRGHGIGRPRQSRPVAGGQQHADAVVADGQRDARSNHAQRLEGASERSDRACSQHCRRGVVRHVPREARTRAGTPCFRQSATYPIKPVRTRSASASTSSTTTTRLRTRDLCGAPTRSRRSRIFLAAHTTHRALRRRSERASFRRPIPMWVFTCRTSGKRTPR